MPEFKGRLITPRLAAAPSTPLSGEMYYDTGLNQLLYWNGSAWSGDPLKVDKDSVVVAATRIVASKLLAGDAQPAFQINGDGKINWGPGAAAGVDTTLYRGGAHTLRTDSDFSVGGYAVVDYSNAGNKLYWGSAGDTNLYRAAAGVLKTDGGFQSAGPNIVAALGRGDQVSVGYTGLSGNPAGLIFGSAADTNLYRNGANSLKTDGNLSAGGAVQARQGLATQVFIGDLGDGLPAVAFGSSGNPSWRATSGTDLGFYGSKLYIGSAGDTNLYRFLANYLKTDSNLLVGSTLAVNHNDGGGKLYFGSGTDTDLYRYSAGVLSTLAEFYVASAGAAANKTKLSVNVNGLGYRNVEVGAADSGGSGYRMLRVTN